MERMKEFFTYYDKHIKYTPLMIPYTFVPHLNFYSSLGTHQKKRNKLVVWCTTYLCNNKYITEIIMMMMIIIIKESTE